MRKYLLKEVGKGVNEIRETTVSVADIENADEVFLTNAINGIRWIRQFRDKIYSI
jgi:branched-chain amino acid aminotransferase